MNATIKTIETIVIAAKVLLADLPEEINERNENAIDLQHALNSISADELLDLEELVQLFVKSAAVHAGGEENADLDEMLDITERSVALAEKMGVTA